MSLKLSRYSLLIKAKILPTKRQKFHKNHLANMISFLALYVRNAVYTYLKCTLLYNFVPFYHHDVIQFHDQNSMLPKQTSRSTNHNTHITKWFNSKDSSNSINQGGGLQKELHPDFHYAFLLANKLNFSLMAMAIIFQVVNVERDNNLSVAD